LFGTVGRLCRLQIPAQGHDDSLWCGEQHGVTPQERSDIRDLTKARRSVHTERPLAAAIFSLPRFVPGVPPDHSSAAILSLGASLFSYGTTAPRT